MEPVVDERVYSGRYQVTHLVARGGMAMVYRAHDLLLNRYVALKILYPELSIDRTFVERFRREAQAAANLSHPNIVPIFDWGEEDGTYFIVMELVEGTSLDKLLGSARTLTPAKSAEVCAQVASALSYAHRQGVVHRDVKPGNILLTDDGQVKVTDFGIAQAISTQDNLTVAGSVMGTATYFSPEQAAGDLVDGRSDVYSLGVVLYELLAGRPPFIGDTPLAVASKHVRELVPSPRQFNTTLPSDLEAIVLHALAKRPADRYASADDLRADLLRFAEGHPVTAAGRSIAMGSDVTQAVSTVTGVDGRTQAVPIMTGPRTDIRRRRRHRAWPYLVALLVLLLAGGGAYAWVYENNHASFAMPNVVGDTLTAATMTLQGRGLVVQPKTIFSAKPVDTVLTTSPPATAMVKKGQTVSIVVSGGDNPNLATVPSVVYESVFNAEEELTGKGFSYNLSYTSVNPDGYVPGTVISQDPLGNTSASKSKPVALVVVAAGTTYTLTSVAGDTQTAAVSAIVNQGLTISTPNANACSNTVTRGYVVGTNPPAGTQVTSGQAIQLIVSTGKCEVAVPDVVGETQNEAYAALEAPALGLVPDLNYLPSSDSSCVINGPNYVVSTTPPANTMVLFGSSVTVNWCPSQSTSTTSTSSTTTTTEPMP